MKLIGSLIIFLSLLFVSKISSNRLFKRVEYIKLIIEALGTMKSEMVYNMTSISKIIEKLNKNVYFRKIIIFEKIYKELLKGSAIEDCWNRSLEDDKLKCILNKDELEEIKRIGSWLGSSDIDNQISNIDLTLNRLKKFLNKAEDEKNRYYKIYNSLGPLFGIGIVILMW